MSKDITQGRFRELGLLPFQADFAVQLLKDEKPTVLLLRGPAGSGKRHATYQAISEGIEQDVLNRVLYLTSSTNSSQAVRQHLHGISKASSYIVDRSLLREFEAAALADKQVWPDSGVFITTIDFAKRIEVVDHFVGTAWDLVVFDEAHRLGNPSARQEFFQRLVEAKNKKVLLIEGVLSTTLDSLLASIAGYVTTANVMWRPSDLRNWDGQPFIENALEWQIIGFEMHDDEVTFLDALKETGRILDEMPDSSRRMSRVLLNRATSCLYSVEGALMSQLRRLQQSFDRPKFTQPMQRTLFDNEPMQRQRVLFDQSNDSSPSVKSTTDRAIDRVMVSLNQLEDLPSDSKYEAVAEILRQVGTKNVCVLTQYASTVSYLQIALLEADLEISAVLVGSQETEDSRRELHKYTSKGGLLLATDAALQGVELPEMDTVIHYDLPHSREGLMTRLSRFRRFGQANVVKMLCFVDENAVTAQVWKQSLEMLESLTASPGKDAKERRSDDNSNKI